MKKKIFFMKGIAAFVLVFALCLSFGSCSDDSGGGVTNADVVGLWVCPYDGLTLTFRADNTFTWTELGSSENGTYTVSGNTVMLTFPGEGTYPATVSGNTISFDGDTYTKSTGVANPFIGIWTTPGEDLSFNFKADGTVTLSEGGYSSSGTYVVSGNSAVLTVPGEGTFTVTISGSGFMFEGDLYTKT